MASFDRNSRAFPNLQRATSKALEAAADRAVRQAKSDIAGYSSGAAKAVRRYPARLVGREPSVSLTIGKGLGRIFEFSKQQNRLTKGQGKKRKYPAGVNRGVMDRHEFFNKAVIDQQRRGLDLGQYL